MFDQTFVDTNGHTRRPWTVAVSLTLQIALVAVALIVPLLRIATLDLPVRIQIRLPVEKVDLKVKPEARTAPHQTQAISRPVFHLASVQAPTAVTRHIDLSPDAPEIGSVLSGTTGLPGPSLPGLLPVTTIQPPAPTPVVKPTLAAPSAPIHVGGDLQAAKLVFGPSPAYPRLAVTTRTQGTVRIQAVIGRDGSIRNLQLIGGPPLLAAAAMEAVNQWRYKPTLLNGEPVEVITVIDVNFTLSQR
jgi:protein TonB